MANKKDLELALRIKADLSAAKKELAGLKSGIVDVATATTQADKANKQATQSEKAHAQAQQQSANVSKLSADAARKVAAAQTAAMTVATQARAAIAAKTQAEERAIQAAAKVAAVTKQEEKAFNQVVGSIDKTERALARLDKAEELLTRRFQQGKVAADDYARYLARIAQQRNALNNIAGDANTANTAIAGLAASAKGLRTILVAGVAGASIVGLTNDIVKTNLAWQQAVYTMQAATASGSDAAKQLDFVREISDKLGLELLATSQAYAQLMASAKEEPELAKSLQDVFEGVAMAGTALHKTPADMQGILLALEQMVSKGKVQTQELVLQLGQRVPGAFHLAAKALNTNTAQLSKWLEDGVIPASEFLPRFGAALKEVYGPAAQVAADGLQAKLNRLTNAYTKLKIGAGDSGFIDSYATAVTELTKTLNDPATAQGFDTLIQGLGQVVIWSVKAAAGIASFTKFVAERLAKNEVGLAFGDVDGMQKEITSLNRNLEITQYQYDQAVERGDADRQAALMKIMDSIQAKQQEYRDSIALFNSLTSDAKKPLKASKAGTIDEPFKPASNGKDKSLEFVKQLEQEAATVGKTREELRLYAIAQAGLSGALLQRARAANEVITTAERQVELDKQAKDDIKALQELQTQYWQLMGDDAAVAAAEIEKKFGDLRARLNASGNADGVALIDNVVNMQQAERDLDAVQNKIRAILEEQQRLEQSIQVQREAGNMSAYDAQEKIVDLHRETSEELLKQRPLIQEMAKQPGAVGEQGRAALAALDAESQRLQATLTTLQSTLQSGLTEGFTQALTGLAQGTMNLREAITALGQAVLDSLTRMAAEALAQQAVAALFGGGNEGPQLSAAALELGVSGDILSGAAAALSLAAKELASAGTAAATTSTVASVAGVATAATGGYITGPGTGTSDSIPAMLSNREFVTRAAVTAQPGARAFLSDFNRRGMSALVDYAPVKHATGGLAGVPAPALPSAGFASSPVVSPAANNHIKQTLQFNLIDDPKRLVDALNTPAGVDAMTVMISRDPAKFRAVLGL